ncbi:MAG: helix-turn-helix domain-containing protein [Smithellaceae bacterium]|jgi:hypothetical protein
MDDNEKLEPLLKILIQVVGSIAIPVDKVEKIVCTSPEYVKAFNLCDGGATQREIATKCKIDHSNLSKAVKRWVASGVAFQIGPEKNAKILHLYPIPESMKKKGKEEIDS